jgi:hypothetical protein
MPLSFLTSQYAQNIYILGVTRFSEIPPEYVEPVKQYAANRYTVEPWATPDNRTRQLDIALANGWINQQEYDDTVALIV